MRGNVSEARLLMLALPLTKPLFSSRWFHFVSRNCSHSFRRRVRRSGPDRCSVFLLMDILGMESGSTVTFILKMAGALLATVITGYLPRFIQPSRRLLEVARSQKYLLMAFAAQLFRSRPGRRSATLNRSVSFLRHLRSTTNYSQASWKSMERHFRVGPRAAPSTEKQSIFLQASLRSTFWKALKTALAI